MPLPIIPLVFDFLRNVWSLIKDRETRGVVYLVIFVLISGMIFYHTAEGWTWLDSLYFSVTTLTTVGLGDLSPKTDAGKAFTIVYILVGLGILAGFLTMMAQKQQERGRLLREQRDSRRHAAESPVSAPDDQQESL